jgi:hypothetical protein
MVGMDLPPALRPDARIGFCLVVIVIREASEFMLSIGISSLKPA